MLAGIWDEWHEDDEIIKSCTIRDYKTHPRSNAAYYKARRRLTVVSRDSERFFCFETANETYRR
ncbi:hypothetical protein HCR_07070 [Hydrogenimonas cancrithermarum]|uniref:Uncharacterized protein n=1 Tax=Hydrogenimonas cancrithermarum TaxID=2993563 RepID=A0ABM8FLX3_9BACT|nr:hypothetical protein HCR_07070 [Hydrogenimonas cancrithermarum]